MPAKKMSQNPIQWKQYVSQGDVKEIEKWMSHLYFECAEISYPLVTFERSKSAPCVIISPGSAGHAYVFTELAYLIFQKGFNVFIMPQHGDMAITPLVERHNAALRFIAQTFNDRIGFFAEGLGGYVVFYAALGGARAKSIICQNSPAIMNEKACHRAYGEGGGAARRRAFLLPLIPLLARIFPSFRIPIRLYLNFSEMTDSAGDAAEYEKQLVDKYERDPDFDRKYSLRTIASLIQTAPPRPLEELTIPTMFLVPTRGVTVSYIKDLFYRLPEIRKKLIEVSGGVFWMVSHPVEASQIIAGWFHETL